MSTPYYFDTSALLKRYFNEPGTPAMGRLLGEARPAFTAALTYAELYAAVYRVSRDGLLSTPVRKTVLSDIEADWACFAVIDFSHEVRAVIPKLMPLVSLRGADAVHLASAYRLRDRGIPSTVVASDRRLLAAAVSLGFSVLDPTAIG